MTTSLIGGCTARGLSSPWSSPEGRLVLRANATREEWLRVRRSGIGSSDASTVLGLNRWSSPYVVWAEKRGLLPDRDEDNDAMELGRLLEPIVVDRWSSKTGIPIRRAGLMANRQYPFLLASVDRLAGCGGIVEAKTLSYRVADEWEDGQTPDHAEAQSQHQMLVTGRDHVHVVGLQDGRTWLERRVDRDEALQADILAIEVAFWGMVRDGIEPPIDGSKFTTDALNARWPSLEGDVETDLPAEAWDLIVQAKFAAEQAKQLENQANRLSNELRALMGPATLGWLPPFIGPCRACQMHPGSCAAVDPDGVCCEDCDHQVPLPEDPKKRPKVIYRRNGTFRRKEFEADHPGVAAAITHPMPTFDLGALERGRPELYAAYRSRVLRMPKIPKETP